MKILLIEDHKPDAILLRELLSENSTDQIHLFHLERLGDALEALKSRAFDIALLDLSLPDAFGQETFRRLNRVAPSLPIIVLTGIDDQELAMDLAQAGAQDYLVKSELSSGLLHRSLHYAIERKRTELKLRLAATVFESTLEGIMITDAKTNIISVNEAFCEITGYVSEEIIGCTPTMFESERHSKAFFRQLWDVLNKTGQWRGEIWNRRKSGEVFPAWVNISAVPNIVDDKIGHYVAVFTEITELKLSEERLNYLAHHDPLTGLPNRLLFQDRLAQGILQAQRRKSMIAVMFLDLDRFKLINDTLGHPIGDELLVAVAERLRRCARETDTIARLGGDEFAVILSSMAREEDVEHVAQKIIQALSSVFCVGGHEVFVTTSIGITFYPGLNNDRSKLLEQADVAMYHAKKHGRNNYQYYTADMNAAAYERLMLETNLRRALEREEFRLYYQPQIDVQSGAVTGVEALIRWQSPELGLVSPGEFIPLLEETGLIVPVGEWVIETACRQMKEWLDAGYPSMTMAVNLSARQFHQVDLVERIAQILQELNLPPELLELELTESMVMESVDSAVEILHKLKRMGVKVAIDDFGTGVSSLGYLKHFPVDTLKISHDFVLNLPRDSVDASIASAVINLARNMQLSSVAEGVENAEQMDFLSGQDCERLQGYLFSRPVPAEKIAELLGTWQAMPKKSG
ncbi:putative bifunctional diguanylate cyclase/phosphodiesterase [Methylotuvimicrobium alcaliphilum]|uniref:cyclic-guanylate-specific phosphodiesterase n=1 Tax=Methylotuvimicrobium alcaliphilum (strain DSM 19304 / NCIMB 14124 / VKM B-2133 / 20Z) TaxID=1091494 RepID=G4SZ58_META2|nr:EAL domain-containing protein [Methylotuvimicrobium alcaliphilum]CCE22208.1 Response regulator receiver modulated diguanylate cyclase/phosphodiesterase with PAS/PAC sensor(S) [Methylotuvimicrobium alcaliphilum 20Z]